jgi:hypothetical protein
MAGTGSITRDRVGTDKDKGKGRDREASPNLIGKFLPFIFKKL